MRKLLVVLAAAFAACVSTNATRIGPAVPSAQRPEVKADDVVLYTSADKVPGKYEEVALLHSAGNTMWTNEEGMYKSMKKKAGKMGANGIILDAVSEPGAGAKVAGAIFGTGAERKGKAVAIYVFPPEQQPQQ